MVAGALRTAVLTNRLELNQKDLAAFLGIDYDRLRNLIAAKVKPKQSELDLFRSKLGLGPKWPQVTDQVGADGQVRSLSGMPLVRLPMAGKVAAGDEQFNVDPDLEPVYVPPALAAVSDVGFEVEGDSMNDLLEEGDACGFKRTRKPYTGMIYLFDVPGKGKRVKVLMHHRSDWYLCSTNRIYRPELLPEGTQRLGMLVGYYRDNEEGVDMQIRKEGIRLPEKDFTQIIERLNDV